MSDKALDLYTKAHLVVAAIRLINHRQQAPPTLQALCEQLSFSKEEGGYLCNKLAQEGIVDILENVGVARIFIKDHLKIENLPRSKGDDSMQRDLQKFKAGQKGLEHKIKSIQAASIEKQKNLFKALNSKLKEGLVEKKDS